jgi:hypothetical protein
VLIFPADLFARLLGGAAQAGSLDVWMQAPPADLPGRPSFLSLFVLATWWVGALGGAYLVWRAGGRALDLLCGLLAGAVLGLAGCATLGCLLVLGDEPARALLRSALAGRAVGPALATALWLLTTLLCWVGLGGVLGLVMGVLGRTGHTILATLAAPLAGLLRLVGLGKAADFFALRGG